MLSALERQVQQYNESCKDTCAKVTASASGDAIVAICSPLMKRVHTTRRSGELCFIDSSGCMDRENARVFVLLTHSCAGGLPLGVIFTPSEDEATIVKGLELLKQLLPDNAFDGKGEAGPAIFISDDCAAERAALHKVFPRAARLLCTFHKLQAVWRWLRASDHGVSAHDRAVFYALVKDMLYADEVAQVELLYQQAMASTAVRFVQWHGFESVESEREKA